MKFIVTTAALLLASTGAAAQTSMAPILAPVVLPVVAVGSNAAVLRSGTEVSLKLLEQLTTAGKKLKIGQRFRMETAAPILVQGITVVPSGSPAVGEITEARNKGMWGKSGRLSARLLSLTVNGRQIRLSGAFDDKGVAGGIGATAVAALVFLPAGFFMTGTSAIVPMGATVKGFIDEDVTLNFAAGSAPLVVGVPAAAAATAVTVK